MPTASFPPPGMEHHEQATPPGWHLARLAHSQRAQQQTLHCTAPCQGGTRICIWGFGGFAPNPKKPGCGSPPHSAVQVAQLLGSQAKPASAGEVQDFRTRSSLSAALRAGDIDRALAEVEQYAPGALQANPRLLFRLRCQKFVELVRPRAQPLPSAQEAHLTAKAGIREEEVHIGEQVAGGSPRVGC